MGADTSFTKELIPVIAEEDDDFAETSDMRGVYKDTQAFYDYMKTVNLSTGASTRSRPSLAELLSPEKEPSLAEKLNMPRAESRFASPEAPEALAELLVTQAKSKKVNSNTDSRLQAADFRNKPELIKAIEVWNRSHPDKHMTYLRQNKSQLTLDELETEATANEITFADIKQNAKRKVKVKGSPF